MPDVSVCVGGVSWVTTSTLSSCEGKHFITLTNGKLLSLVFLVEEKLRAHLTSNISQVLSLGAEGGIECVILHCQL